MLIQGYTSDFSLPELFKLLQNSQQSGRLTLKPSLQSVSKIRQHFFWFEQGYLVAASHRLDGLGLITLLQQRALLQSHSLARLLRQCPANLPFGDILRENALFSEHKLRSLFTAQMLSHTCTLLQSPNVYFAFYPRY
ncbi:MAG: DUF4388 domain-containing protein, partial [Leptolyngbya sp. SIO4C1]|nr:DUF4388 domain-containing protein [Leptolyngbya sp. SIO4C1]